RPAARWCDAARNHLLKQAAKRIFLFPIIRKGHSCLLSEVTQQNIMDVTVMREQERHRSAIPGFQDCHTKITDHKLCARNSREIISAVKSSDVLNAVMQNWIGGEASASRRARYNSMVDEPCQEIVERTDLIS